LASLSPILCCVHFRKQHYMQFNLRVKTIPFQQVGA
jgi:hypothetical protein